LPADVNLPQPSKLRTLLVLGRVSNLPTIWSNCLAGWWLAGGGSVARLTWVSVSTSLLYLGGMFLNDAFDSGFDRNHRPTRPIPAGLISEGEVWLWGIAWLLLGLCGLIWFGLASVSLGVALVLLILLYDAIHKIVVLAPIVMGSCRLFVYLVAASVGINGVTGETIWKGIALAGYVVGLSYMARKESAPVRVQYWPVILLGSPLLMAGLIDDGSDSRTAIGCSILLVIWMAWTVVQTMGREHPNVGRAVARLLAGIALVDLLAVADLSHWASGIFLVWFFLALLLQTFVPAT
jgi:4-hydroxybenzoate polyprenyltransferase